jgi:hypothetical protein
MSFQQNKTAIVDLQFVHGNNFQLYAKELVILKADSISPEYYLFRSPYSLNELGGKSTWQNEFNFKNINGLKWEDGHIPYMELGNILDNLKDFTIVVKGQQKLKFLSKFLKEASIINLDTKCSLKAMKSYIHNCPTHDGDFERCAVNNVFKILIFMEKQELFQ